MIFRANIGGKLDGRQNNLEDGPPRFLARPYIRPLYSDLNNFVGFKAHKKLSEKIYPCTENEQPKKRRQSEHWIPFSVSDSNKLENAFNSGSVDPIEVAGGRYIADLVNGLKTPVYWTEDYEVRIRRGGWYSSSGGGFQPLSEETSEIIDITYEEGRFPTKISTPDGDVMIHNTEMAVILPPGCVPDQYGVVPEGQLGCQLQIYDKILKQKCLIGNIENKRSV